MKHILIIDDDIDYHQIVGKIVQHQGFSAHYAHNGCDGLTLAQYASVDLIVLDMHLPDISGFAVLHRLAGNEKTRHIPVIVISSAYTPQDILPLVPSRYVVLKSDLYQHLPGLLWQLLPAPTALVI